MNKTDSAEADRFIEGCTLLAELKRRRRSPWSWLLDASIFFSFDASGYRRHLREAMPERALPSDAHVVITGGNSGLGFALADQLLARGAQVSVICRDQIRGERARMTLAERHPDAPSEPALFLADLGDLESIKSVGGDLRGAVRAGRRPPVTHLIHNAGLLPLELSFTPTQHELTVGVHLIGPTRLTAELLPCFANHTRVIWMSSGGMYTAPLSVKQLMHPPSPEHYDGVYAYALTKRAQVELATLLHARFATSKAHSIDVQSAHPGWADTPGVERSLATFHRRMSGRLRTSDEGALATTWLATLPPLPEGLFWFDWAPRSPYLLGKRPSEAEREALWSFVCEGAQLDPDWISNKR